MNDFSRIDRLIREAHVQRSAAVGTAIGEFLADSSVLIARVARNALAAVRGTKAQPGRRAKAVPAR
jgi:hypothetical protein